VKARPSSSTGLPDFVEPMQAKLVDSIRPGEWIYEIKFDGYRALALRGGSEMRVMSRNKKTWARNSPRSQPRSPSWMSRMRSLIMPLAA
jgi:bifunctional non-homologous end joining protein LigD